MRASRQYLAAQFAIFNEQCFGGKLPPVTLLVNNARSRLGVFRHVLGREDGNCIAVSRAYDMDKDALDDVLLHEMIHYYLHVSGASDPTPHGPNFLAVMAEINSRFGRNISVRSHLDEATRNSGLRPRVNLIAMVTLRDGREGFCVCGPGSAAGINSALKKSPSVKAIKWYGSTARWFSAYPLVRSARIFRIPEDFPYRELSEV